MYFQSDRELDSSRRDRETFCPASRCPNTATLITVSPFDLTLVSSSGLLAGREPWAARRHRSTTVHTPFPSQRAGEQPPPPLPTPLSQVPRLKSESRRKLKDAVKLGGQQCEGTLPLGFPSEGN